MANMAAEVVLSGILRKPRRSKNETHDGLK